MEKSSSHKWLDIQIKIKQIESVSLSKIHEYYEIKLSDLQKLIDFECPQTNILLQMCSYVIPFATNAIDYVRIYWRTKENPQFENINLNQLLNEGVSSRSILLSKEQILFLEINDHPVHLKSIFHYISVNSFITTKNQNIKCPCDLHGCCLCIFRCNIQ